MTDIAIINAASPSLNVSDEDVIAAIAALQKQVSGHFQPAWGIDATLHFFSNQAAQAGKIPPSYWQISLLDNSDHANALGYHDMTSGGFPIGKVFVGSDIAANESWTVTLSHEILEMLADPAVNISVLVENKQGSKLVAFEVCDPCADDKYGYKIDNILVSDFVYPAWFETFRQPASTRFDHQDLIGRPLQLLQGGSISMLKLSGTPGWQMATARPAPDTAQPELIIGAPAPGTRKSRRHQSRADWKASTAHGNVPDSAPAHDDPYCLG